MFSMARDGRAVRLRLAIAAAAASGTDVEPDEHALFVGHVANQAA
jgi:hypothetical protein